MLQIRKIIPNKYKPLQMNDGQNLICTVMPKYKKMITDTMREISDSPKAKFTGTKEETQLMKQAMEKCATEGKKFTGFIKEHSNDIPLCASYNRVTKYNAGTKTLFHGCIWQDGRRACLKNTITKQHNHTTIFSNKEYWFPADPYTYVNNVLDWIANIGIKF